MPESVPSNVIEFSRESHIHIFKRVHSQLELLKFVPIVEVESTSGLPTHHFAGQGPELRFVTLPDLLLDFRSYNIDKRNNRTRNIPADDIERSVDPLNICTVGGRAARTACALQHLLTDEDGTFRVSLIAKTGNLGHLLLKNEFSDHGHAGGTGRTCDIGSQKTFESVFLPTVLARDGEPRCALLDDGKSIGHQNGDSTCDKSDCLPHSVDPTGDDEVSELDVFGNPLVRQVLEDSTCIFLSSIRSPVFTTSMLEKILGHAYERGKKVFIDVERSANENDIDKFTARISALNPDLRRSIAGIFVSMDRLLKFFGDFDAGLKKMSAKWHAPLIVYGSRHPSTSSRGENFKDSVYWYDKTDPVEVRYQAPNDIMIVENAPERFKAGVLLAFGLRDALQRWTTLEQQGGDNCARMLEEWKGAPEEFFGDVLCYALFLAMIEKRSTRFDPLDDYYKAIASATDWLCPTAQLPELRPPGNWEFSLDEQARAWALHLAGCRRMNLLSSRTLPKCSEPKKSCVAGCIHAKSESARAAIMFDLDGTLLNSTHERTRALTTALWSIVGDKRVSELEGLRGKPPAQAVEFLAGFFTEYVYNLHAFYHWRGLGDFRQQWNHEGWYAVLFCLLQSESLHGSMKVLFSEFTKIENETRAKKQKAQDARERKRLGKVHRLALRRLEERYRSLLRDFDIAYQQTRRDQADIIRKAVIAFQNVRMIAFKEARDCLVSLKQTGAFSLYVVSEGDPATQWHKIESMGLQDIFEKNRVLTTGDAANPETQQRLLAAERNQIDQILAKKEQVETSARSRLVQLDELKNDLLIKHRDEHKSKVVETIALIEQKADALLNDIAGVLAEIEGCRKQKATADAVERVFEEMSFKAGFPFYAAVVRSILQDPDNPAASLKSISQLISGPSRNTRMKFAMIGDRQDNDIAWPLKLLGNGRLVAIRILSGKYSSAATASTEERPAFELPTLAHVKAVLLNKATWESVSCASAPKFFNKKIIFEERRKNRVGRTSNGPIEVDQHERGSVMLRDIVHGVLMNPDEYPVINRVCTGILIEVLVSREPASVEDDATLLERIFEYSDIDPQEKALLFARLVNAGLVAGSPAPRDQELERIVEIVGEPSRKSGIARRESREALEAILELSIPEPLKARVRRALDTLSSIHAS